MQKNKSKHIILANDLAGLGKVALANQIPIMACAGIETSILPTVILSSHTGGFEDIYINDYTIGMKGFLKQWNKLDVQMGALLTGYLKNKQQIDILLEFMQQKLLKDASLIVDPVMADNGKFYAGFNKDYAEKMKQLCSRADYITPNITEARILTDCDDIRVKSYCKGDVEKLLLKLKDLGAKNIVITGVSLDDDNLAVAYYDSKADKAGYVFTPKLKQQFFGTGDLFTAIISACILHKIDLGAAVNFAVKWLEKCLNYTIGLDRDLKYGVEYEGFLADFIKEINALRKAGKNEHNN